MTTSHHNHTILALIALLSLLIFAGCASDGLSSSGLSGDGDIRGGPTISASYINQVLTAAGSPAVGLGDSLYQLSEQYGIDDAVALAFFHHESSYGEAGVATVTHSLGNIRCTPGWQCYQGYRSYSSWSAGAADWFQLISSVYLSDGRTTIATIIPKYAPSSDHNNEASYISSVQTDVKHYHSQS